MKRFHLILVFVFFAFFNISGLAHAQSTPIQIYTCQDLQNISNNLSGSYALAQNIYCTGISFVPIGSESKPFQGILNGNGYVINGLTINLPNQSDVGLFGYAGPTSQISNVGLVNTNINGGIIVGSLVGQNYGTITYSYNTGSVSGTDEGVGGLAGVNGGVITESYNTAAVSGGDVVGGLVGMSYGPSSIFNSYNTGFVQGSYTVGGVLGWDYGNGVSVLECYSTGQVLATGSGQTQGLQGLIGGNDLWNTFSAASQVSVFQPASPMGAVNWTNISNIYSTGVNWTDLLVLSRPLVWGYLSAVTQSGYLSSVNWTDLAELSTNNINWVDMTVLSRTGIDWAAINPLVKSGLNWTDWLVATTSGTNWNDVLLLSQQSINWDSVGILNGNVNWSDLSEMTHKDINWALVSVLSKENVNWDSSAVLNRIPITAANLKTLRTIAVSGATPTPTTAQLTLNLTGNGAGTFTSSPAGINCTLGSGTGCVATFPLNQQVTLSFTSINNSLVNNWGGCTPTSATSCTVTPDQSTVVNIAVNIPLTYAITTTTSGSGSGRILCNGETCPASVPPNTTITFTAIANPGSVFTAWGDICAAVGGSATGACTVDNINSPISVLAIFNRVPLNSAISLKISGTGQGIITSSRAVNSPEGLVCSIYSSISYGICAATFASNQPVTLRFFSINQSSVTNWGISGCASGSATCTFTPNANIQINVTVTAPVLYTISAGVVGTGGRINPSRNVQVHAGANQTFTIIPDPGYGVYQVVVDGEVQLIPQPTGKPYTYTFTDVTMNHAIQAAFTKLLIISTIVDPPTRGSISPKGPVIVQPQSYATFNFIPNPGYKFSELLVDGHVVSAYLGANNIYTYTFTDVTASHTMEAVFQRQR